jgi:acetyltransferase-like isoleucine patch superfamily enzyme
LKFLLVASFYGEYLDSLPVRPGTGFASRIEDLLSDGFGMGHMVGQEMSDLGWDSTTVVCNDRVSQDAWCREHGVQPGSLDSRSLLALQIQTIRPDILYLLDPIAYDSSFLRALSHRPPLVAGWRSAPVPADRDFSEFDAMFTNTRFHADLLSRQGARRVEWHMPGFRRSLWETCKDEPRTWDLSFTGQWSDDHQERNRLLMEISKIPLRTRHDFSIGYHIFKSASTVLPAGVAMHDQGARWGRAMLRALRSGRTTLHLPLDQLEATPAAMRLFEATGMGVALFAPRDRGLSRLFEPDSEVLTYSSADEIGEKISWLLEHPDELDRISRKGQERCFRDHSMSARAQALRERLESLLSEKESRGSVSPGRSAPLSGGAPESVEAAMERASHLVENGDSRQALAIAEERLAGGDTALGLRFLKGVALLHLGDAGSAAEALRSEIEHFPGNENARRVLDGIRQAHPPAIPPVRAPDGLSHSGPGRAPDGSVVLERRFPGVGFGNHVQILGLAETSIGEGSIVGEDTWLNVAVRDGNRRLSIGKCVCIGRHNMLSTAGNLEIGDYCLFGPQVFVSDADHGFSDPFVPYVAQPVTSGRNLTIEENCWIGFGVAVTGGITLGRGSVVGSNSVVKSDVEPFSVVVGSPARVVRMYDPIESRWVDASTEELRAGVRENRARKPLPTRSEYREILARSGLREITPLAAGGDRVL